MSKELGFNVELPLSFEAAVTRVREGAQAGGIRRIDVDRPACSVPGEAWLGVPFLRDSRRAQSATRVQREISVDPSVGLLLPCNVTIEWLAKPWWQRPARTPTGRNMRSRKRNGTA